MSPNTISSRQNPKIKQARRLRERKVREQTGLFLVEGIRHVGEAVQSHYPLAHIFYAPDLLGSKFAQEIIAETQARGILCHETSPDILNVLADKTGPQGIIAVARQRTTPITALTPDTHPWLVAVIAPQDPGNLGTILRTMDAVSANGLILLDGGVDPWHPTAVRASMGAVFWLPVAQTNWEEFAHWSADQGFHLFGTSAHGSAHYQLLDYPQPCILLLGSEREGLTTEQSAACHALVRLPMEGRVTSLNLAVAAGIMLYTMKPPNRQ